MGSCKNFCKSFFFTVTALVTMGLVIAALVAGIIVLGPYSAKSDIMEKFRLYGIIATVVVAVLLVACIALSFVNKKWARTICSIIYLVFDVLILALAILVFIFNNVIVDKIQGEKAWEEILEIITNKLDCTGWDPNSSDSNNCAKKFGSYIYIIGGVLLGLFVILTIAIVIAFYIGCKKDDEDEASMSSKDQFNTPLTYGW